MAHTMWRQSKGSKKMAKVVFECIPANEDGKTRCGALVCIETQHPEKCVHKLDNGEMQITPFADDIVMNSSPMFWWPRLWRISTRFIMSTVSKYDVPSADRFIKEAAELHNDALIVIVLPE